MALPIPEVIIANRSSLGPPGSGGVGLLIGFPSNYSVVSSVSIKNGGTTYTINSAPLTSGYYVFYERPATGFWNTIPSTYANLAQPPVESAGLCAGLVFGGSLEFTYTISGTPTTATYTPIGPLNIGDGFQYQQYNGSPASYPEFRWGGSGGSESWGEQAFSGTQTFGQWQTAVGNYSSNSIYKYLYPSTVQMIPGAPTGLTATSNQNEQVPLSWTATANPGGSTIIQYLIQWSTDQVNWSGVAIVTSSPTTVFGYTNGMLQYFRVAAQNSTDIGPYSAIASAVPSTVPSAPSGLTATSNENAQSTLNWTVPASNGGIPITGYLISVGLTLISLPPTPTSYVVTGLTNGTTYSFQVAATNANPSSPGPYSAIATATPSTVPSAPTGLTATSNENAQSTLNWTAPTSDGGSPIINYNVSIVGAPTAVQVYGTQYIFTGLTNGTTYSFQVAAVNANPNSPGPYSAPASATPSTVPDAPINLKATPGNAQVQLSWASGPSDGGSPITNYKVEYKLDTSSVWSVQYSMTTLVIYFLKNGSLYNFRVSAINVNGQNLPPSPTANATPFIPFTTTFCGIRGFVPGPPPWSRAGGNNCPNCVSNYGYADCTADNGLVYSTYALDQRRKAEILKYRSNSAQLSPGMFYSMISRNAFTRKKSWATQTQTYTNPNVNNLPEIQNAGGITVALECNQPPVLCSLTSDSDVPGPVIPLCIDASVPLYNYKLQVTPSSGGKAVSLELFNTFEPQPIPGPTSP